MKYRIRFFIWVIVSISFLKLIVPLPAYAAKLQEYPEPRLGISSATRCPAPVLLAPANELRWPNHTLQVNWQPVTGCTFSGYEVCTFTEGPSPVAAMANEDCSNPTIKTNTHWATLRFQKKTQSYYWKVRAIQAPDGAQWSIPWSVTIDPTLPFYQLFLPVTIGGL